MRTEIYYDGSPVFSGICPTPIVGRSESFLRYGRRWANVENLSLQGVITGCGDFATMLQRQSGILNGFSNNYKVLSIQEQGQTVYSTDIARIESIDFGTSSYAYQIPFTIDVSCYPSGFFSGVYGVVEPVNSYSFQQENNQVVGINHTVSARGINTSSTQTDALQNAIDFCTSNSGISNIVSPTFISGANISDSVLQTTSVSVNRLEGTCALNESWVYDPLLGGTGILRYSTDFNSGNTEGVTTATLKGSIQGGENVDISNLRSRFSTIDHYSIVSGEYAKFFDGQVNQTPTSIEIEDDPNSKLITFNYSFDDDPRPNPSFDDSFSLNLNEIDDTKTATLDVTFKWRGNCKCNGESGWNQIKSTANSFNYFQLASEKNTYYDSGSVLKQNPISSGISENKNNCELTVSLQYEHLDTDLIPPDPLQDFEYTVSVRPAIPQYSAKPTICSGHYSIYNLNYFNRAEYTLQGTALTKSCGNLQSGVLVTKCMVEQLASQYVTGQDIVITSQSFQKNLEPESRGISFSYSWTAKVDPVFPSGVLYV